MKIDAAVLLACLFTFCFGFFLGGGNLYGNCPTQQPQTVFSSSPQQQQQPSSSSENNNLQQQVIKCPACPPCQQQQTSSSDSTASVGGDQTSSSSAVSVDRGPAIPENQLKNDSPFFKDLPESFLRSLANPNAPVSILRGGQPKCLAGLSTTNDVVVASSETTPTNENTNNEESNKYDSAQKLKNFREVTTRTMKDIGTVAGSDKVVNHRYYYGYDLYLGFPCIRKQSSKIKMLEIGLGCLQVGHRAGPRSVGLWGKFLPNAQYTAVEFNKACAREWDTEPEKRNQGPTTYYKVYQGDQSDFNRWKQIMKDETESAQKLGFLQEGGGPVMYDLIIDDGGHTMLQQVNTFLALWPHIKPGGVYVIEDMLTNWASAWGGSNKIYGTSHLRHSKNLVKHLMDRVHTIVTKNAAGPYYRTDDRHESGIFRVDCTHMMCAIVKRWPEGQ